MVADDSLAELCRSEPSSTTEYALDSRCFQSVAECQFGIVRNSARIQVSFGLSEPI
jgi:hypothetical protein